MSEAIKKHYRMGLFVLLPFALLSYLVGLGFETFSLFLLGFAWSLFLLSPGIYEKAQDRRYKFSFFRLVVVFAKNVEDAFKAFKLFDSSFVARALGPILFSIAVAAISDRPSFILLTGWGFIFCEISMYCLHDYFTWKDIFRA